MFASIPADWRGVLAQTLIDPRATALGERVSSERVTHDVFPEEADVFAAFRLTPFHSVRAVIIGQDPYHGPGQADGLAFSVPAGVPTPPSLRNILSELARDLEQPIPTTGSLAPWAQHGVLLLNTALTVRRGEPASHSKYGWHLLCAAIIKAVNAKPGPVVFLLWGAHARAQGRSIDRSRHIVIEAVHPSPLSAYRGFVGSAPFRRANEELVRRGATPIDWRLP
jgi:uracil-DNA glycosylase